jgi:pseudouridine synthase
MADCGIASRRKCEELILGGHVKVNGAKAVIGTVIDPGHDTVELDGAVVSLGQERVVIMFNKPRGVICTNNDPKGRKTTAEYFSDLPYRLYNVGRLDYDSEGLILITNDGEIADRIMHPRYKIDKTYYAVCGGELTREQIYALENGVMLSEGMTAPAKVKAVRPVRENMTSFEITIHEGRNRQIRRMLEAVGHETLLLRRIKLGELELGKLRQGEWRYLSSKEIKSIMPDRI